MIQQSLFDRVTEINNGLRKDGMCIHPYFLRFIQPDSYEEVLEKQILMFEGVYRLNKNSQVWNTWIPKSPEVKNGYELPEQIFTNYSGKVGEYSDYFKAKVGYAFNSKVRAWYMTTRYGRLDAFGLSRGIIDKAFYAIMEDELELAYLALIPCVEAVIRAWNYTEGLPDYINAGTKQIPEEYLFSRESVRKVAKRFIEWCKNKTLLVEFDNTLRFTWNYLINFLEYELSSNEGFFGGSDKRNGYGRNGALHALTRVLDNSNLKYKYDCLEMDVMRVVHLLDCIAEIMLMADKDKWVSETNNLSADREASIFLRAILYDYVMIDSQWNSDNRIQFRTDMFIPLISTKHLRKYIRPDDVKTKIECIKVAYNYFSRSDVRDSKGKMEGTELYSWEEYRGLLQRLVQLGINIDIKDEEEWYFNAVRGKFKYDVKL